MEKMGGESKVRKWKNEYIVFSQNVCAKCLRETPENDVRQEKTSSKEYFCVECVSSSTGGI
jgi:hypothetical protein